jgi:hypothetical protein
MLAMGDRPVVRAVATEAAAAVGAAARAASAARAGALVEPSQPEPEPPLRIGHAGETTDTFSSRARSSNSSRRCFGYKPAPSHPNAAFVSKRIYCVGSFL